MTPKVKEMYELIKKLELETGELPKITTLCEITGSSVAQVISRIKELDLYEPDQILTPTEERILEVYRTGMNIEKVMPYMNVSRSTVTKALRRLTDINLIDYRSGREECTPNRYGKKPKYIEIITGEYEGLRGYLFYIKGEPRAKVYKKIKNRNVEIEFEVTHADYKIIEKLEGIK